jgi:hypothetical protein
MPRHPPSENFFRPLVVRAAFLMKPAIDEYGEINLRFSDFGACLTRPAAGVRRFRSRVNQYADSARLLVLGQSANVHTRAGGWAATCVVLARRRASECEENCCLVRYRIDLQFKQLLYI